MLGRNHFTTFELVSLGHGLPGSSALNNLPTMQETHQTQVLPLGQGWEDHLEEGVPIHPIFLPGESHG